MLSYAIMFLIIALISGVLGFGVVAGTAAWIVLVIPLPSIPLKMTKSCSISSAVKWNGIRRSRKANEYCWRQWARFITITPNWIGTA